LQGKIETRVGIFVLAALCVIAYMGFQIGAFRFDRGYYAQYVLFFKDISGLSHKADVKIAGVKVGWVDEIKLQADGKTCAQATVMVLRDYHLHTDAYAVVRQDGLLGPHFVEVIPGDPLLGTLSPGDTLMKPSVAPVSVDELLHQFKKIAVNVEEVTHTFKQAVGGPDGEVRVKSIIDNLQQTAEKMSVFSEVLERTFVKNEENIETFLAIGSQVQHLAERLDRDVFPSFQDGVEKIATAFDRDLDRIANRLESTAQALEQASIQARDGLRNVSSVAEKIDEGKGLIGKLINEDDTYQDLKVAVQGFKNYMTKLDRLQFVFDVHFEGFYRRAENYEYEDSKGYFDIRIHPNEDYFYLVEIIASEKGFAYRKREERDYITPDGHVVSPQQVDITNPHTFLMIEPQDVYIKRKDTYKRNTFKFGLQFGKVFSNIALRFGLFEGSGGVGLDFEIPFESEKFRWVTTLEFFDMHGWNRRDDKRPHLKWINRMFILRSIYCVFGAEDFASKRNAGIFAGVGVRFGDDNVKYILSSMSGAGGAAGGLLS